MRCTYCNEKIAVHDLWCTKCYRETPVLKKDLSAMRSLKASWQAYSPFKGQNFPTGILAVLTGVLPMALIIWVMQVALPEYAKWMTVLIHNLVWLVFLPVMLVPFRAVCYKDSYSLSHNDFIASFRSYGRYWMLSLYSILYYFIIFYVCKGDPILNLVWLVLVIYWVAINLPVPVLMERYQLSAGKALLLAYKKAGDVRWNLLLMAIVLVVINLLAAILLVVGLAITVPFTWIAIRDYTDRLIEYELFD